MHILIAMHIAGLVGLCIANTGEKPPLNIAITFIRVQEEAVTSLLLRSGHKFPK